MPVPSLLSLGNFLRRRPQRPRRGRRLGGPSPAQRKFKFLPPGTFLPFPDRRRFGNKAARMHSHLFRGMITSLPHLPVFLLVEARCTGADEWALVGVMPRALRRVVRSAKPEDHGEGTRA